MRAASPSSVWNAFNLLEDVRILILGRSRAMDQVTGVCISLGGSVETVAAADFSIDAVENFDAVICSSEELTSEVAHACRFRKCALLTIDSCLVESLAGNLISLKSYRVRQRILADLRSLKVTAALRKEYRALAGPESKLLWTQKGRKKRLF